MAILAREHLGETIVYSLNVGTWPATSARGIRAAINDDGSKPVHNVERGTDRIEADEGFGDVVGASEAEVGVGSNLATQKKMA